MRFLHIFIKMLKKYPKTVFLVVARTINRCVYFSMMLLYGSQRLGFGKKNGVFFWVDFSKKLVGFFTNRGDEA
jgi:tRNA G37 N-methylase Trm5